MDNRQSTPPSPPSSSPSFPPQLAHQGTAIASPLPSICSGCSGCSICLYHSDDDDDDEDDTLLGRQHAAAPPQPPVQPSQLQIDYDGLDVDAALASTMPLLPTNTPTIIAALRPQRPPHMAAALWDRFVLITNESREAQNQWENRQQALAQIPQVLARTMARIAAAGFAPDGSHSDTPKAPNQYTKDTFRIQRPSNFLRFPQDKVGLAQKGLTERYSNVGKNGARYGACAKLHSQMVDNGMYWRELMDRCRERESEGWSVKGSKGTGKGKKVAMKKGNKMGMGMGKGKGGSGTTTKAAAARPTTKRKKEEDEDDDDDEDMEDLEDVEDEDEDVDMEDVEDDGDDDDDDDMM